jgi:hypothetical protein
MSNRKPTDTDLALSCWSRLTMIEQCSLAILHQALLTPEQWRLTGPRRRQAIRRETALQRPASPFEANEGGGKRRA